MHAPEMIDPDDSETSAQVENRSFRYRAFFRHASVLDVFRVLGGVFLLDHYTRQAGLTSEVVRLAYAFRPTVPNVMWPCSLLVSWFLALGPHGVSALPGIGAVLAALIVVGLASRVSAGLLIVVSAGTYYLLGPAVLFDDYLAEALSMWLAVLPVGRTLSVARLSRWRKWNKETAAEWQIFGCVIFFVLIYIQLGMVEQTMSRYAWMWFGGAILWVMTSTRRCRPISAVILLISLWPVVSTRRSEMAGNLLAGLCAVSALALHAQRSNGGRPVRAAPAGVTVMIGACAAIALLVEALGMAIGRSSAVRSAESTLAGVGLPWSWDRAAADDAGAVLDLGFARDRDSAPEPEHIGRRNRRMQAMLRFLGRPTSTRIDLDQSRLTHALVAWHCEAATTGAASRRGAMAVLREDGHVVRRAGLFLCGEQGEQDQIMPLER